MAIAVDKRLNMEITNGSLFFFNRSDVNKYNKAEYTLPGSTILTLTICTAGIVANSLIIIVVLFGSLRKYVIMNLLLALAITENVCLLVTILKQRGLFGTVLIGPSLLHCRLTIFFLYATGTISSWITVVIALERFIAIFYPFKVHTICTRRKAYVSTLVIIVLSCVALTPVFFGCSVFSVEGILTCSAKGANAKTDFIVSLSVHLFCSIIPCSIVTILNILIIKRIRSQRAFRIKCQGHTSTLATRDAALVSMMIAICTVFVITSFPSSLLVFYYNSIRYIYGTDFHSEGLLLRVFFVLEDINHCVNFFLYCITGSIFRNALFDLLKYRKRQSYERQSHQMMSISQNV